MSLTVLHNPTRTAPESRYYGKRHVSPQWCAFLAALSCELFMNASKDEARAFCRQVGKRMAASLPLPASQALADLEKAMNATLETMDWGWVRLTAADSEIRLTHSACPLILPHQTEGSREALTAVLEGLYTEWFRAQGSLPSLTTTCIAAPPEGPLQLRHGR